MMTRKTLLAMVALAATATVWAHHSVAQFDFDKTVSYTGTVKTFTTTNPHTRMVIELKDAKGTRLVEFLCHSISSMFRNGYRKGMVKIGDKITVSAAPLRDGNEGGYVLGWQVKGGESFGEISRSSGPAAVGAARRQAEGR